MPTKRRMSCQKFYLSSQFELKLIMTKNITRVVMKPLFKNDLPIIKNHLTKINMKTLKGSIESKVNK